jgi:peptidyl-prolyl cis-trans isomerase D
MLTGIRRFTQGWIAGGLLSVLIAAFAVWGIQDVFRTAPKNAVAAGRGVQITAEEFRKAFDNALEEIRAQSNGQAISTQDAVDNHVDTAVLQRLMNQKALDRLASQLGIGASDAMIAKAIRDDPNFKSQLTGAFDKQAYQQLLAQNGLTPAAYENQLRSGLRRRQIALALAGGLHAPKSFASLIYNYETERRVVSIASIPSSRIGKPPEPTEAQLQAFYKENAPRFATPEYRRTTLVIASPQPFEAKANVPEDEIQKLYEFRKPKLGGVETRSFVQISAPTREAAEEAARRLAAGEDAQKIASSLKLQAINFDKTAKAQVPDPAIAEAVFALKPGQTTGAIKGRLAWATARVTDIVPGSAPSYDSMRESLRAELAKEQAKSLLNDAVQKFEDARSGGKSLEEAAKEAGLTATPQAQIDAEGRDPSGAPDPAFASDPALLKAVFQAPVNEMTDFMPAPDGSYVLARVDAITPPGVRAFADVKPLLTLGWKARQTGEAMRKFSEDFMAAVNSGKGFAETAKAMKLPMVATSQSLTRQAAMQGGAQRLGAAIFAAKKGGVVSEPDDRGDALLIAKVEDITRQAPEDNPQLFAQAQQSADQFAANDLLLAVQDAAVRDAKFKTNEKLLKQTLGVSDAASPTPGQ